MKKLFVCLLCLAALPVGAEKTRRWKQSSLEDFEKGIADKVAIRSDGTVSLAPKLEELYDVSASYLWDLAIAPDGTVYAAAGPEAKVFRLGADGRKSVHFETDAVEIHALALDSGGTLYAATAPESRIYKIDASGGYELFYDPQAAYVWDMAFGPDGALYVATGDQGEVHRVEPSGSGEAVFETGETHVRSMAFDSNGDLVIGTDPGGLVMRISAPAGDAPKGFVLHQSRRKEMTAIAVGEGGAIYAAGVGVRTAARPTTTVVRTSTAANAGRAARAGQTSAQPVLQPPPAPAAVALQVQGGSSIVRISADGQPLEVWSHDRDVVYALGFDGGGRLLAGSGEGGRLIRIESEHVFSVLTSLSSNQVTALALADDGKVLLAASNVGRILSLGPDLEEEGSLVSDVLDAKVFARFGRIETENVGDVAMAVRTGNLNRPGRNWSDWSEASEDGSSVPPARYAQWKATLRAEGETPPSLDSSVLYYRPSNAAPRITHIETTPPNHDFPAVRRTAGAATITLPALGSRTVRRTAAQQSSPQTMIESPGRYGVRWKAEDANGDKLLAAVSIRGEGESSWIEIAEDLEDARFSFDSSAFADGLYRLQVTVSDSLANPEGDAMEVSRTTEAFRIDNSQPAVDGLTATMNGGRLRVRFRAVDGTTKIAAAEYSLDGGDWTAIRPTSGLFDSKEAEFDFPAGQAEDGPHTLARVRDERGNQTAAKAVIR